MIIDKCLSQVWQFALQYVYAYRIFSNNILRGLLMTGAAEYNAGLESKASFSCEGELPGILLTSKSRIR